jgi:lipopolysaccharide/colanic/teichoic acid biosynthesis glycosyltransferase
MPPSSAGEESFRGRPVIRSAPERFFETWLDALGGFLFCVVLPIPIYATGEPFAEGIGATERTILATAVAWLIVWYCARRLDAFPRTTLQGNVGYVAPVAVLAYAFVAVVLLLLRSDYSRVQLVGSGVLTVLWSAFVAQLRARYLVRNYAVMPSSLLPEMPASPACRWLTYDDVEAAGVRADAMVADLGHDLSDRQVAVLAGAAIAGVPVLDRRFIVETLTGRTPLGGLMPNEFGALLPSRQYLLVRRSVELLLTLLLMPLLLAVIAIVAVAVRLDSPGPIFFPHNRVGQRGRIFSMLKFRTMYHGMAGPSFTRIDDPRVTRIGRVLRRYRLDEVPQLLNVLRGEMSWVGPRPETVERSRDCLRDIPHFALRAIVRPGVTGWAQINQNRVNETDEMRAKVEYDLYYLKHCSLWLDLMIVLRTFAVVLGGAGAR